MRILFDARSVRTTTGSYVLRGLTSSWRDDTRVSEVLAAIPEGFDASQLHGSVVPVPLPTRGGWLRHLMFSLVEAADRVRADIIFCANGTGPVDSRVVLYFQDLFHFQPRNAALPIRGQIMEFGRAAWRSIAAPRSGLGIAVSRAIADEAQRDVASLPIVEIPNGVEVEAIRWVGDQEVVYVAGGTGARKSEETAIRAWARLGSHADTATLVIGGVEPAHRRAELQRLASGLGLGRAVELHGALPRRAYLERMARARVTVSCSRLESFGLPVAEALVIGAPVLCSDLAAHRELVGRARAGTTFPAGDESVLAARLREALDGDLPRQLSSPPPGWDWNARGREHIDAYQAHLHV